jgi:hypothetical protein
MRWFEQRTSYPLLELRAAMLLDLQDGSLVRVRYDHNGGGSGVRSNKVMTIHAARILGRKPDSFDEVWELLCQVFFGYVPDRRKVA